MSKKKLFLVITLALFAVFAFTYQQTKTNRRQIYTEDAPKPIVPYSQAILAGNTLYVAGQIGLDPASGKLDSTGVEGETRQALKNIYAILQAAGMNMTHIARTTIYLKNMKDFARVNQEYATWFTGIAPPARETLGVAELPKGASIEISIIAVK